MLGGNSIGIVLVMVVFPNGLLLKLVPFLVMLSPPPVVNLLCTYLW